MKEIWKDVVGFENCYEVSSKGEIRSKDRFVNHWRGGVRFYKGKNKKSRKNKYGYMRCNLKTNAERFDFSIHQLVAKAFIPNPENKEHVNHKNGIKTDNRLSNLEWVTPQENTTHAVSKRLIKTKLKDSDALKIHDSFLSIRKLASLFDVNPKVIWRIKNEVSYKHLWS